MKTALLFLFTLGIIGCFTDRKAQKAIPPQTFAEMQSPQGHVPPGYKTPMKSFDRAVAAELKARPGKKMYMLYAFEGDSWPRTQIYKYQSLLGHSGVQPYFISNNHDMTVMGIMDSIAPGTIVYMADGNAWRFEMRPKKRAIIEALLGQPRPKDNKMEYFIEFMAVDEKNQLVYLGHDPQAPALQTFLKQSVAR